MFAIVILSTMLAGQCASGQCATVSPAPAWSGYSAPGGQTYVIKRYKANFEGIELEVEGYYNPERGTIVWSPDREFNRRSLAAARASVAKPQSSPQQPTGAIANFGLSPDKIGTTRVIQASPEAKRFIAHAKEAAAPGKLHLTVIGTDDDRAPVMNDIMTHPSFASLKEHLYVQGYKPDEWPVDPSLGFQVQGKPSILLQASRGPRDPKGGRVVYRALDYTMGPQVLATAVSEEVRKVDPSYQPTADPGPAAGNGGLILGLTNDQAAYVLIGAVALFAVVTLPRKDN